MSPVMMKPNSKEEAQETRGQLSCKEGISSTARGHRPLSVVTTNAFDDDAAFMAAVRSIFIHQETKTMSERDAINAVLVTIGDKRSFLESMDSRCYQSALESIQGGDRDELSMTNMAVLARQNFGDMVRLLWREGITGYKSSSPEASSASTMQNDRLAFSAKQKLLHSPMRSASRGARSFKKREASILPKSSGRQRRRFFPDASSQSPLRSRIRLSVRCNDLEATDFQIVRSNASSRHPKQQITQSPIYATV